MNESHSPSRRTVLTGAAWSAPVIAFAVAAPAATASVDCSTNQDVSLGYTWEHQISTDEDAGTYTVSNFRVSFTGTAQDGSPLEASILAFSWPVLGVDGEEVTPPLTIRSGEKSEPMHYTRSAFEPESNGILPEVTFVVVGCNQQITIGPPSDV